MIRIQLFTLYSSNQAKLRIISSYGIKVCIIKFYKYTAKSLLLGWFCCHKKLIIKLIFTFYEPLPIFWHWKWYSQTTANKASHTKSSDDTLFAETIGKHTYSRISLLRPPLGLTKSGLNRKVISLERVILVYFPKWE